MPQMCFLGPCPGYQGHRYQSKCVHFLYFELSILTCKTGERDFLVCGLFLFPLVWCTNIYLFISRWKHAALCHHNSTIVAEDEVFERDDVYKQLVKMSDTTT